MLKVPSILNSLYGLLIRWSCVRVTYNPPTFKQNISNLARYFDCQKYRLAPQNWTCSAKYQKTMQEVMLDLGEKAVEKFAAIEVLNNKMRG